MEISEAYLRENYKILDKGDIQAILSGKNPQKELELRVGVNKACSEEHIMKFREQLNKAYNQFIKYEN